MIGHDQVTSVPICVDFNGRAAATQSAAVSRSAMIGYIRQTILGKLCILQYVG